MSDAVFRNADHALRFAFDRESKRTQRSYLNRLAAPSIGGDPSLAGLDGAAQAGMIRAEVAMLGALAESFLKSRFAPKSLQCGCGRPCCRGSLENPEWREAIARLANEVVRPTRTGAHHVGLRFDIVRRYFAGGAKIQDLVKRHGFSRDTVSNHNSWIVRDLKRIENKVMIEIEARLAEMGLVPNGDDGPPR